MVHKVNTNIQGVIMEAVSVFILLVGIFNIKDVHSEILGSFANYDYDGDLATSEPDLPLVSFALFTSENPDLPLTLHNQTMERFRNTTSKVIFLIYGWNSNPEAWYKQVKLAFLHRDGSSMVIEVDWSKHQPSSKSNFLYFLYVVNPTNLNNASSYITDLMVTLYEHYDVPRENFLLVGHSLGGQLSGYVGKAFQDRTSEKLPRIIALDPAGIFNTGAQFYTVLSNAIGINTLGSIERLQEVPFSNSHIRRTTALVEVIHTDNYYGFKRRCGTIDFFVNGGGGDDGEKRQPGCANLDKHDCDHHRAIDYFAEALLDPKAFVARKFESYYDDADKFIPPYSCDGESVCLGDISTTLTGLFYLETNGDKPYPKEHGNT